MKKTILFSITTLFLNLAVSLPIPLGTYAGQTNYFYLDRKPTLQAKQFPCSVTFTIELDKKTHDENFNIKNFRNSCPSEVMSWEVSLPTLFLHGPNIFKIDGIGKVSKTGFFSKNEMTITHTYSKNIGGENSRLYAFQEPISLKAVDGDLSSAKRLLLTVGSMLTTSESKQPSEIQYYQTGIVTRTQN